MALGEQIDPEDYVVAKYRVTANVPIEKAAESIAAEQSTGTWTGISTLNDEIFRRYAAKVTSIDGDIVTVAYPKEDFSIECGGVPQILSVIAGNLFGLETLRGVRLEDVDFCGSILRKYPGPKFGDEGLRKMLDRPEKPLVGTIVKPKIGLSPKDTAAYIYEAGSGGLTNSKDDETLVDQAFCPIEERTKAVAEAIDRLREEGHRMVHAVNISTDGQDIPRLAEDVQSWGANQIMIDVLTCGYGAVRAVAGNPRIKVPVHVHRTMHGAMTKDPINGISMRVVQKLVRMCGGDALHIGTLGVGKMAGNMTEGKLNQDACQSANVPYRKVMPVCSGGMYPGIVPQVMKAAGTNIQIQAGGGVAGHPRGVRCGAMAMCQAIDAAYDGISLEEYQKDHAELRDALDKWGTI